jgi:quercetin dioxygenase-like cupin family protein
MKILMALATLLLAMAVLMTGAGGSAPAVYVDHDKVNQAFGARVSGNAGQIATTPIRVVGNQRSKPGEAEIHEKVADVFMVMEGGSTMVTGGTVVGGKTTGPGEIKGTSIQGGHTYQLSKGDVMIVPAGVPHWHKEVPKSIVYYTVKVPKTPGTSGTEAVYVSHEKVAQTFGKRVSGNTGSIANAPIKVVGNQRNGPGEAEVHENVADVFMVMDGSSTIVTGGTLVGGKMSGPGEIKGTGVQGGQTVHLSKGDVMIVPAGTPHWHKEVPQSITYYTVKVPNK